MNYHQVCLQGQTLSTQVGPGEIRFTCNATGWSATTTISRQTGHLETLIFLLPPNQWGGFHIVAQCTKLASDPSIPDNRKF
jgi:hypothetical protein